MAPGEVAEWSNAPHSKCGIGASLSGVRIPPSPPETLRHRLQTFNLANVYRAFSDFAICTRSLTFAIIRG